MTDTIPTLHIRHPLTDIALCGAPPVETLTQAKARGETALQMAFAGDPFHPCQACTACAEGVTRHAHRLRGVRRLRARLTRLMDTWFFQVNDLWCRYYDAVHAGARDREYWTAATYTRTSWPEAVADHIWWLRFRVRARIVLAYHAGFCAIDNRLRRLRITPVVACGFCGAYAQGDKCCTECGF